MLYPEPSADATRVNETASVDLNSGEQATVAFEAENRVSSLVLPIVAISKYPGFVYEISRDGSTVYGPSRIPPTDIDDLNPCFIPALQLSDTMTIEISNLSTADRTITVQAVGWEPTGGAE